MNNTFDHRKAIATSGIAIILFGVASLGLTGGMILKCKAGAGCNPFSSESLGDKVTTSTENAKAIGAAHQFMLGLEVPEDLNMFPATQKYAYCREGPGRLGQYRCTDTPEQSDIEGVVAEFSPYPENLVDFITSSIPFLDGFAHRFTLERNGNTLMQVGSSDTNSLSSTFIFMAPIAGGENIKLKLEMTKGSTAAGVVEQ